MGNNSFQFSDHFLSGSKGCFFFCSIKELSLCLLRLRLVNVHSLYIHGLFWMLSPNVREAQKKFTEDVFVWGPKGGGRISWIRGTKP